MYIPSVIDIENVRGLCNARCVMCNIDSPKVKPGKIMDNSVFEQILRRFTPHAANLTQINFVGMGEPLIDPEICNKIATAKRIFPAARQAVITNAALLSPELRTGLLENGCDDLIVSIDSIHKEVYESIRKRLNFNTTMENIDHFIRERDRRGFSTKVLVRIIEQAANQGEWNDYVAYWRKRLNHSNGDMILLFPAHQWPSDESETQPEHLICPYLFNRMSLTAEGMIQLCCVDIGADFYPIGSILTQDPLEVFNGAVFNTTRQLMESERWQELPYCNRCNVPLQREKRMGVAV